MKEINISDIINAVESLCIEANLYLNEDIRDALKRNTQVEESDIGCSVLESLIKMLILRQMKGYLFARIQVWLYYLLNWAKRCILTEEALKRH